MNIKYDDDQLKIIDNLNKYVDHFNNKRRNKKSFLLLNLFLNREKNSSISKNIYLYGKVGRGKTMLMQDFYNKILVTKQFIHFQAFMQSNYLKLHDIKKQKQTKFIPSLARLIRAEFKVLCIDEFEILDIADAMIIAELFKELIKCGVFIFLTTNTKPEDLYKDGLQRNSFLPFIEIIKNSFEIINLENFHDYRFDLITLQRFFKLPEQRDEFDETINQLTKKTLSQTKLSVFGRELLFKSTNNKTLVIDFNELIDRDLGYNDFVTICQYFKIIILKDLDQIGDNDTNKLRRFINFIDNVYFNKVTLFLSYKVNLNEIYLGNKTIELERTFSRLNELGSK